MDAKHEDTVYVETGPHHAARPMRVVVDDRGCRWLCDADVDETKDLKEQGCWRCGDLAFTRDD
jgi:hypothetical protein